MHAEEDKKAKEAIEIKNNADNLAYQCEKQLKELGDKISGRQEKEVEDAIAAVRDAINRNDTDAMKRTYDDLAEQIPGSQRRTLQTSFCAELVLNLGRNPDRKRSRVLALRKALGLVAATATLSMLSSKSSMKIRKNK